MTIKGPIIQIAPEAIKLYKAAQTAAQTVTPQEYEDKWAKFCKWVDGETLERDK